MMPVRTTLGFSFSGLFRPATALEATAIVLAAVVQGIRQGGPSLQTSKTIEDNCSTLSSTPNLLRRVKKSPKAAVLSPKDRDIFLDGQIG